MTSRVIRSSDPDRGYGRVLYDYRKVESVDTIVDY